ncbi:MAG: hypothetical protein JKX80_01840 [Candidatus Pacebacteria bacterium]|nr:hypothetical protein [Candidatus Paceibacterota bacterium]
MQTGIRNEFLNFYMFIIHVTPIAKGGLRELSYFSSQEFPVGTIVYVPLRNKEIPALVLEREDARAIKSILRTNVYETRKVRKQVASHVFSPEFVRAARTSATYFATSPGSVIHSYVPAAILSAAEATKLEKPSSYKKSSKKFERLVLQIPRHARFEKYKTIIRGNFAKGKSIFLCVPTLREARFFEKKYSRGIEKYTFLLESSQTKKKQQEIWNAILSEKHPVLIIATPTFVSIPRGDISMFIIENEMSSSYKQQVRPHIDARILIENLARETNSSLIYAGTTVSVKIHKFLRDGLATEIEEQTRKLRTDSSVTIIDSKAVRRSAKEEKANFPVLSPQSISELQECQTAGKLSFVFAARRGIASQTICNDCSNTIKCTHCKSPMILHGRHGPRKLMCHRCGSVRDAHETCVMCGSWDLVPLGVGAERIEEFLTKNLTEAKVFVITSDTTKTPVQARKIVEEFYTTPGAILVGTEMALSYLTSEVSCSVMSSIDSLLCIPDFHIEERVLGIITILREQTKKVLLIETTSPENSMLKHAKNGSLAEYAEEELALRKKLKYPPYAHIIKVTSKGTREAAIQNMQKFVALTQEKYKPRVFAGFIERGRDVELHALIRITAGQWPDSELATILENLPMSFSVDVDPERTL